MRSISNVYCTTTARRHITRLHATEMGWLFPLLFNMRPTPRAQAPANCLQLLLLLELQQQLLLLRLWQLPEPAKMKKSRKQQHIQQPVSRQRKACLTSLPQIWACHIIRTTTQSTLHNCYQ